MNLKWFIMVKMWHSIITNVFLRETSQQTYLKMFGAFFPSTLLSSIPTSSLHQYRLRFFVNDFQFRFFPLKLWRKRKVWFSNSFWNFNLLLIFTLRSHPSGNKRLCLQINYIKTSSYAEFWTIENNFFLFYIPTVVACLFSTDFHLISIFQHRTWINKWITVHKKCIM